MKKSTTPGGSRKSSLKGSVKNSRRTRKPSPASPSPRASVKRTSSGSDGTPFAQMLWPSVVAKRKQDNPKARLLTAMLEQFLKNRPDYIENMFLQTIAGEPRWEVSKPAGRKQPIERVSMASDSTIYDIHGLLGTRSRARRRSSLKS